MPGWLPCFETRIIGPSENNPSVASPAHEPYRQSRDCFAVERDADEKKLIRVGDTNMPDVISPATFFWAASLVSLVGFCIHTIAGQRLVVTPLMGNEHLELQQRWFHFVAWHGVSISFAAYTAAFAYAALTPAGLDVAILMTVMNAAIALMFIGVGLKGDPMVFKFPGIYLALGTTALGVAGVLVSWSIFRIS